MFALERTYLAWIHMAITVGAIAAAMVGVSGTADAGSTKVWVLERRADWDWSIIEHLLLPGLGALATILGAIAAAKWLTCRSLASSLFLPPMK